MIFLIACFFGLIILNLVGVINFWGYLLIPAIFMLLDGLGIYIYFRERFVFKNGIYKYVKPFKKSQSAYYEDIAYVEVKGKGMFMDVIFWGKDGTKLINFYDDGTSFRSGEFERSLKANNIKCRK